MLEIDGVRAALSYGKPYDHSDFLGDRFLQAITIATDPSINDHGRSAVRRRLDDLHSNRHYILAVLEIHGHPDGTLPEIYENALEQVEQLVNS